MEGVVILSSGSLGRSRTRISRSLSVRHLGALEGCTVLIFEHNRILGDRCLFVEVQCAGTIPLQSETIFVRGAGVQICNIVIIRLTPRQSVVVGVIRPVLIIRRTARTVEIDGSGGSGAFEVVIVQRTLQIKTTCSGTAFYCSIQISVKVCSVSYRLEICRVPVSAVAVCNGDRNRIRAV